MAITHTNNISAAQGQPFFEKQEVTKGWLQRCLRRHAPPRQENAFEDRHQVHTSLGRPQTAPSTGTVTAPPPMPVNSGRPVSRPQTKPSPRPPRPDSNVVRDVNAWLDTSTTRAPPPLMGGLQYWREGPFVGPSDIADVRYAVPIVCASGGARPARSHSQNIKSFCRRAKKMQVRMPSLLRTNSQRPTVQKQLYRRSASMPLMSMSYQTHEEYTPRLFNHAGPVIQDMGRPMTASATIQSEGWFMMGQREAVHPRRHGSPASVRFGEPESTMERRINAVFGQSSRPAEARRPSTAAAHLPREDSMGNLSDAPTYFSGLPPPSYRSRAASIVSTSSFGCIDGMSAEQRQLSQQRAAQRSRGMKGRFKRLVQKAHFNV
ncbi:hypothetical protein BDV95DRAFT_79632 [Massariosphaeria phaeospora]|uniref:Uncharacterized protein n=1 Tax=Massariosphaeria phaeospora TaxID=100035 RepID=A0A7C8I699_9PLEO|nr:hypothetical protein BDV95DRAFT_79632 [Massariosphaeria phaeospora]